MTLTSDLNFPRPHAGEISCQNNCWQAENQCHTSQWERKNAFPTSHTYSFFWSVQAALTELRFQTKTAGNHSTPVPRGKPRWTGSNLSPKWILHCPPPPRPLLSPAGSPHVRGEPVEGIKGAGVPIQVWLFIFAAITTTSTSSASQWMS